MQNEKKYLRKRLVYIQRSICIQKFKFLHETTCALDHKQIYNDHIEKTQNPHC